MFWILIIYIGYFVGLFLIGFGTLTFAFLVGGFKNNTIISSRILSIIKSLWYTDDKGWFIASKTLMVRHLWEFPQVFLGFCLLLFYAFEKRKIDFVPFKNIFAGMLLNSGKQMGISLGCFIFLWRSDDSSEIKGNALYMHEYGHTMDSRIFGVFYLIIIGLPSIISAATRREIKGEYLGVNTHHFRWFEMRANRHAAILYKKVWGGSWQNFENYYPRSKRAKPFINKQADL